MLTDVIQIIKPDPDSQYRLIPCDCGGDNVAFEQYQHGDDELWRVRCFDCGLTVDSGTGIRHEAQLGWNRR